MTAPVLVFTDYTKPFLLETDASKDGLGAVLSQKQADGWYHPIAYGSRVPTSHEKNYHSYKHEFLALKWAVMEHFKEYLPYQSFMVTTNNNPLTYIISIPNLDATGHWWVGALVQFNFELEYQKGCDNTVADVLSWVTTQLDPDTVKSILNGVAVGTTHHAKCHDPAMVEGDQCLEQKVCVTAGSALVEMHVTDWAEAEREDPLLDPVLLAGGTEADRFESTSDRTCLQWRRQTDLIELTEFCDSSGYIIPMLNAQMWDWRSPALHGPQGPLCCCIEWVPLRYRTSRVCGPFAQSSPTPDCGHHSNEPFACGLYQHRDDHGAE